jgi:hypothetical protein
MDIFLASFTAPSVKHTGGFGFGRSEVVELEAQASNTVSVMDVLVLRSQSVSSAADDPTRSSNATQITKLPPKVVGKLRKDKTRKRVEDIRSK